MTGPVLLLTEEAVLPLLEPASASWLLPLEGRAGPDRVQRRFNADLNVALVLGGDAPVRSLSRTDAGLLGYREAQLFDCAFSNLHRRAAPFAKVAPGVYVCSATDAFTASRLMLPRVLEGLTLVGEPVAFVPNRNTLIITGSDAAAGLLEAFARVRLAQQEASERVTLMPLRHTDYGWEAWLPEASSPARASLEQLVHEQLSHELTQGSTTLAGLLPQCAQPTIGTRISADGRRREVVVALGDEAGDALVPYADGVLTREGATLSWSEFARQNAAALTQVEGSAGAWYRLARS